MIDDCKESQERIKEVFSIGVVSLQVLRSIGLLSEVAKSYRAFYDALLAEGFTSEQAMTLVPTYRMGATE